MELLLIKPSTNEAELDGLYDEDQSHFKLDNGSGGQKILGFPW